VSPIATTPRLRLREFEAADAAFILELLNDPGWICYIGDKGLRTPEDAVRYIEQGPRAMYARCGFGLYAVERGEGGAPVGMCGLVKRDTLDDVDLGFAFLEAARGQGYAFEAAMATLAYARDTLGLARLVAIVTPDNAPSRALLAKLGFAFQRMITPKPEENALELHAVELAR
jgi:RimJ/RimL family protein N-acetyltransferase